TSASGRRRGRSACTAASRAAGPAAAGRCSLPSRCPAPAARTAARGRCPRRRFPGGPACRSARTQPTAVLPRPHGTRPGRGPGQGPSRSRRPQLKILRRGKERPDAQESPAVPRTSRRPGPAGPGGLRCRLRTRGADGDCQTCTSDRHDEWNAGARGETPLQRADRAYGEILQEVRVAQTGVQILFAFLLTLAFTSRFASITQFQRNAYVVTLMLCAA